MGVKHGESNEADCRKAVDRKPRDFRYIDVGFEQPVVSRNRSAILVACGIGSCVCVCVYDPSGPVAGMAHVLLPSAGPAESVRNDARYADVAVPRLIRRIKRGMPPEGELIVKLVGGANMLTFDSEADSIGARNVKESRRLLTELGCRISAEDVSGVNGRTVRFHVATGEVMVTYTGTKRKTKTL